MSLDYTVKYQSKILERFKKGSITNAAAGHEYDFTGARSIKVYSMDNEALSDYGRGSTRYGSVSDATYTTQEMICSQAKSFTKHFEKLDNSDIAIDAAAGKFLKMEIDEVINPTLDKYRLKKWLMNAGTLKQMSAAPTKSTLMNDILELKSDMMDNLVPDSELTLYIPNKYYILLLQQDAIVNIQNTGYATSAVEKGVVGMFENMKVVSVPTSWLPANCYFLIKSKNCTVDPVKLAQYDVIEKSVGYSGPVVQGLLYFDSFVLGQKNVGIGVAGSSACVLAAPVITNTSHVCTITAVSGVTFKYTVDGSDPRFSGTAATYSSGVTLTSGQKFRAIGTKDGCVGIEGSEDY